MVKGILGQGAARECSSFGIMGLERLQLSSRIGDIFMIL